MPARGSSITGTGTGTAFLTSTVVDALCGHRAVTEAKNEVMERKRDLDTTKEKMDKLVEKLYLGRSVTVRTHLNKQVGLRISPVPWSCAVAAWLLQAKPETQDQWCGCHVFNGACITPVT